MYTHKATKGDLPAIRYLLNQYGKMIIGPEHLGHRDISICARNSEGAVIGFLYIGVMAQNTVGYIDKFCVDPAAKGKGVGNLLAKAAFTACQKRGVKEVFGVIRQDEHHDKSAMNALKMAFGAHPESYTYVCADLAHMASELKVVGV